MQPTEEHSTLIDGDSRCFRLQRSLRPAPQWPLPGRISAGLVLLLFWLLLAGGNAAAQESNAENPNRVIAAFLRNFAHYVDWPADAFNATDAPWRIGILGNNRLGEVVETTLRGRTEQGRPFKVFYADTLQELPPCQIVYIAIRDSGKRRAVLAALKDKPVLTVGEASELLQEGGIIRFRLGTRIQMSVNLDQARSVSLKVQTKMLEVSSEVLDNGVIRKRR